VFGCVRII